MSFLNHGIQACIEQHRRAYEIGMKMGITYDAIFNLYFLIPRMIDGGVNLLVVKKEIETYQQLAKLHHHPILETYMQVSLRLPPFFALLIQCNYQTCGNHLLSY
jgi:hypothetical protein